jgi:hypothetical protein
MINDARCTREIKHTIVKAKAALNRKMKQTGLKFKDETSEVLPLENIIPWC